MGAQESWPKARSGKLPVGSLREGAAPRPEARLRRAPRSRPALHGLRCWDGEHRDGAAANLEDAASPELMSAPSSPGSTVCRTGWPCSLVRVLHIGLKPGIPRFTDLSAIATDPFAPGLSRGSMRVLSGARCVPAGSGLPWRTCTLQSSGSRRARQQSCEAVSAAIRVSPSCAGRLAKAWHAMDSKRPHVHQQPRRLRWRAAAS